MRLSDHIASIAAEVAVLRAQGCDLPADQLANLESLLRWWEHDARALEQSPVPPRARLDWANLPEGVVALPPRRPATRRSGVPAPDGAA